MKRRIPVFLIAIVTFLLVFSSCTTSVTINTLEPAKVNIGGYKNIAIRATADEESFFRTVLRREYVPIRDSVNPKYSQDLRIKTFLEFGAQNLLTDGAIRMLPEALDEGFFNIYKPDVTEALITVGKNTGTVRKIMMDNGIDAILSTSISNVYYDEYIISETDTYSKTKGPDGIEYFKTRFYVVQKASLSISYTLTDVENNCVIAYDVMSDSTETKTLVAHTKNAAGELEKDYYSIEQSTWMLNGLIGNIVIRLRNELTPHYGREYFDLMANKPKVKELKDAYNLVDSGYYPQALSMFLKQYQTTGHVASGYNAAVLYYALGQYDEAVEMANDVFTRYGSSKAVNLYYRIKEVQERQERAREQIYSTEKIGSNNGSELVGF